MRDRTGLKVKDGDWIAYELVGTQYFVTPAHVIYDDENYEDNDFVRIDHFSHGQIVDIYRYQDRIVKLPHDEKEREQKLMLLTLEL
jgi:hypothetical protein